MQLNQAIVIRSQFGAKAGDTPGNYISTYTSRQNATEALTPYSSEVYDAYIQRKLANLKVVEMVGDKEALALCNENVTPQSSRLFGSEGIVYTQAMMERAIQQTEEALLKDHTLITPVISFTHDYLVERGIVDSNLTEPTDEESYKGQVDQLKLRRAISRGMDEMTGSLGFVEPVWTGAIHLNTQNVHCHITLIETAPHYLLPDKRFAKSPVIEYYDGDEDQRFGKWLEDVETGKKLYTVLGERGKLTQRSMQVFRQEVDEELVYLKTYAPYRSLDNPHYQMGRSFEGVLSLSNTKLSNQLLRVHHALPENQTLWQYPSSNSLMELANYQGERFAHILMEDHPLALGIDYRRYQIKEQSQLLTPQDQTRRLNQYDLAVQSELVNALYDHLKQVTFVKKEDKLPKDTPTHYYAKTTVYSQGLKQSVISDRLLQDLLADSFEEDELALNHALSLEYRLRRYPERLRDAREERDRFNRLEQDFEQFKKKGQVAPEALVMGLFYQTERLHHEAVYDKYRYLLMNRPFNQMRIDGQLYRLPSIDSPPDSSLDYLNRANWKPWLVEYQGVLMEQAKRFDQENQVFELREELPNRLKGYLLEHPSSYQQQVFLTLGDKGYQYHQVDRMVSKERFERVKMVDLPQMTYDLNKEVDRQISKANYDTFLEQNAKRYEATHQAVLYLEATHQDQGDAYHHYKQLEQERLEDDAYVRSFENRKLPLPKRSTDSDYEKDRESFSRVEGLDPLSSRRLVRHFIPKASDAVLKASVDFEKEETPEKVDEFFLKNHAKNVQRHGIRDFVRGL